MRGIINEEVIREGILKGEGYEGIGKRYGVTRGAVWQMAKKLNLLGLRLSYLAMKREEYRRATRVKPND